MIIGLKNSAKKNRLKNNAKNIYPWVFLVTQRIL